MPSAPRLPALSMILLGLAVAPGLAAAQAADPAPEPAAEAPEPAESGDRVRRVYSPDHVQQTGLSLMPGLGYRVIIPYEKMKDCGDRSRDAQKAICSSEVPLFLDLQVSWGVSRKLDLVMDLRFGIGKDPAANDRVFALSPGLRIWLDQGVNLKFYTTLQMVFDSTDYRGTVASTDIGVRNATGLMYDVIRNVGFFFQVGETLGFRRWFRMELDAGLGVQVRFP